ncbi:MAG: enoyl-CoA hydratase, partial [Candidatus Hydrogenedentes bacterium]|nr:enoyl-CoA hydratase [Candidatus Hydrogenedentota bacterium]
GVITRAVTRDQLEAAVQEESDMVCLGGPNAGAEAKKLVRRVPLLSREDGFAETAPWSAKHFASDEGKEGMLAFREKRKPSWAKS